MIDALVLDASVALAWCFEDESTAAVRNLQVILETASAVIPAHWYMEVANAFLVSERRKRITAKHSAELIALLSSIELHVDDTDQGRIFSHVLPLARATGLTVYDATYLDLAARRGLPLATLDIELRRAAEALGVTLLGV
jgi:predicted nucleic acid-binding protein